MIYVLLADGFEECEAFAPIDILRRAGAEVSVVKIGGAGGWGAATGLVRGSHNIIVMADAEESEIDLTGDIEMLVLPGGGTGVKNLSESETVKNLIAHCVEKNIKIGAICAAPSILADMGLLKGKKATAYPSFQKFLIDGDAEISELPVITDGIFTTAKGAGVSIPFALELVKVLYSAEISEKISTEIQCV